LAQKPNSRKHLSTLCPSHLCVIPFSDSVRSLGVYLDKHLTIDTHVNQLCKSLFFQLRRISKIRQYLTIEAANTLANSFILLRLDYCNSILSGISEEKLNKLQRIQNLAARIVLRRPRHESASALLRTLHWLPVRARIEYTISILCFQCINSPDFPTYLSELVQIYRAIQVSKYKLSTYGKRSFMTFDPTTWNSLPVKLRHIQSLPTFKKHLKTYLFQKYLDN
jgi:hypothetical protein